MKSNLVNSDVNELMNISNLVNVRFINRVLKENFEHQSKLEEEVSSWEEKLMTNLNSMEKLEQDDHTTWYVKFKKYNTEIYSIVIFMVETGFGYIDQSLYGGFISTFYFSTILCVHKVFFSLLFLRYLLFYLLTILSINLS